MRISIVLILTIGLLMLFSCKAENCIDRDQRDFTIDCIDPTTLIVYQGDTLLPGNFPVCGCDNITYPNECEAYRFGVSFWILGPCP